MSDSKWPTQYTKFPTCPYCGVTDQDWWDCLEPKNDGDCWEATCGNCEKEYQVVMSVSFDFCMSKVKDKAL